jgi:hypothetical protein
MKIFLAVAIACFFTCIVFDITAQQPDLSKMDIKQIMRYSDSMTKAVLKEHKIPEGYGISNNPISFKPDTTTVEISFSYDETYKYHTNKENATQSHHKSYSGTSTTAMMISRNGGFLVMSSNKSLPGGLKSDTHLKANLNCHSEAQFSNKDQSCKNSSSSNSPIPDEAGFSFNYDKVGKIGGISGGAGGKGTYTGHCTKGGGGGGSSETTESVSFSFGSNPADAILPDGQRAKTNPDDAPFIMTQVGSGYRITANYTHKDGNATTTMQLIATINIPLKKYQAAILPVNWDYEQWVPKGPKVSGSDDTKGDRTRKFKVVVWEKDDTTKRYPGLYTVVWNLTEVTKYPGFCNNYPAYTTDPNIEPDLKFDDTMKTDGNFVDGVTDDYAKTEENRGSFSSVTLNCMDYAAWGKLRATVVLDNGQVLDPAGPYYERNKKDYLTIPYDLDENKLADDWEKRKNVLHSHYPLTWDEDDKPEKQRDKGDGYTLFEEYRGFAEHKPKETSPDKMDVHVSTDPLTKDVFIYDRHDLFQKYYEPQNPSNLTWHYIKNDQIIFLMSDKLNPLHRVVNFNKVPQYFYAMQYAVVLYKDNGTRAYCEFGGGEWAAGVTYGEEEYRDCAGMEAARGVAVAGDQYPSPVKHLIETVVYMGTLNIAVAGFKDRTVASKILENQIGLTVKHEIGHYIGIPHHYDDQTITRGDSTRAGNTCGAKDCLMRYGSEIDNKDEDLMKDYSRYCGNNELGYDFWKKKITRADGTPGLHISRIKYIFNTNCYGKITVKSSP